MLGAGEHQVLVHLVGDDQHVVPLSDLGDELQLGPGEHLAGRVVGRVEQDQLGACGDSCSELVTVEAVAPVAVVVGPQQDRLDHAPGERDAGLVAVVHRLEQHHLVTGVEHAEQRTCQCFGGTGGDEHLGLRVVLESVEAVLVFGDRLPQHGHPRPRRVLVEATPDRLDGGVEHLDRAVGVGEPLPEVDRPGLHRQRRHLGEDRGAEAVQLRRQGMVGGAHVAQRRRRAGRQPSPIMCRPEAGDTPVSG